MQISTQQDFQRLFTLTCLHPKILQLPLQSSASSVKSGAKVSLLGWFRSLAVSAELNSPCLIHAWQDSQAQFLHLYLLRNSIPEACGEHMEQLPKIPSHKVWSAGQQIPLILQQCFKFLSVKYFVNLANLDDESVSFCINK